jgi:hypothetical protein
MAQPWLALRLVLAVVARVIMAAMEAAEALEAGAAGLQVILPLRQAEQVAVVY